MNDTVKMMLASGWEVDEVKPTHYILKKPQNGLIHFLLALFFWWVLFFPNLVYGIYRAVDKRKVMKEEGE